MLNQDVERLWELQTVLTQLSDREKQLTSKPESFAAIDREWQAANDEMNRLQQSIDQLTKERRRVDGELSDHQEILKKYQGQLMQVKGRSIADRSRTHPVGQRRSEIALGYRS